jgi:hypothetical protein
MAPGRTTSRLAATNTSSLLRAITMNIRRILLTAALVVASGAAANRAQAQCADYGCGYGGYGYGYGYWDIGRLYGVLADNVPYYAAFPPVYYSYPVPRTYGYSPFAYPPGVMTPEVEFVEPLAIDNPYFSGATEAESAEAAEAAVDQTTAAPASAGPLEIVNPYVAPAGAKLATR